MDSTAATAAQVTDETTGDRSFETYRADCCDALLFADLELPDAESIVDEILASVIDLLRRHCGITFDDAELLIADARREGEHLLRELLTGLVHADTALDAIARYLADNGDEI